MTIEGHGCDGALVARDYSLDSLVSERADLYVALLSVGYRKQTIAFAVEGAQPIWIVAGVQTVDQSQVSKVVHICLDSKHNNHAEDQNTIIMPNELTQIVSLTRPCAASLP